MDCLTIRSISCLLMVENRRCIVTRQREDRWYVSEKALGAWLVQSESRLATGF